MRRSRLRPWLLALVTPVVLQAERLPDHRQPEFSTGVELVTVPVTVTSRDRKTSIGELLPADFEVFDDGRRQVVATLTRKRRPLSLSLVVDSSGSMTLGNRRELTIEAVRSIVGALQPEDEIAILFFGETIETRLPWTRIASISRVNWAGWNPYGNTPLNDGLRAGLRSIDEARNARRAIVLLTDGFENASRESTSSIVRTRQQSEATIYALGIGSANMADVKADDQHVRTQMGRSSTDLVRQIDGAVPGVPAAAPPPVLPNFDYLELLVGDSGGSVTRVLSLPEATAASRGVVNELEHEYLVGYVPDAPPDGRYHRLKVEIKRRGLSIRHRGGYLAIQSP